MKQLKFWASFTFKYGCIAIVLVYISALAFQDVMPPKFVVMLALVNMAFNISGADVLFKIEDDK